MPDVVVLNESFTAGPFTSETFFTPPSGSDGIDPNYPTVYYAEQAVITGGQLTAPPNGSLTGWRFAGVTWRNFASGGAVPGGPSSGGRVTVVCTFASDAFSSAHHTFGGYFVPLISVYGGDAGRNGPEVANNVAFQLQFYDSGSDVGVDLVYSDVVNGSGSIFGGAFDETVSGLIIPRATLEDQTFTVTLEWCNSSATHDDVTAWMTVGGSPAPAADGYVRATLGGSTLYYLTNKAIVTYWQPSFPERLNQWNKLSLGQAGLPGPVDSIVAYSGTCIAVLPGGDPAYDASTPCPCPPGPGGGGPAEVPDPVLPFAPTYSCTGGGTVEQLADLPGLGGCWL